MARILIADDDSVMLGLLTTLLKLEGDEALTVSKPEQIVPLVQRELPDLILMDVHLSGGDALQTLSDLKTDPQLQHIPILMASGMDRKTECLAAGADDFILKPFRPADLLERIQNLLTANSAST